MSKDYEMRSGWKKCAVCEDEFLSEFAVLCQSCKDKASKRKIKFDEYVKKYGKNQETT